MAKEEGLSVDEVCRQLMVELAAEEGDESALAQIEWGWFNDIKRKLEEAARRAAEAARRVAEELLRTVTRITNIVGQEVVDAMKAMGKEVGKMTDDAAREFAKWYNHQKARCGRMSSHVASRDVYCKALNLIP